MKLIFKLLAPWFAVGICWCILKNAWLAILAYHAQIVFWNHRSLKPFRGFVDKRWLLAALPFLVAGPLVYFLLPYITQSELGTWLTDYKLTGLSLVLMVPYFGIVHPVLEQLHWEPLREKTPAAHILFAGYHMMVLSSLISAPWRLFCFVTLAAASFVWQWLTKKSSSLLPATLSHILADLGIIIIACMI